MTMQLQVGRDEQIRALSAEECDLVAGARPFGDCNDTFLNFGLFYISVIECPEGTSVSVGTTLFGGHSIRL
jgi:hypothetical protein